MSLKKLTLVEVIFFATIALVLAISLYFGFTDKTYFDTEFAKEDGAIEYGTFFFLLCISLLQFYRLFKNSKHKSILWKLAIFFFGILFLFGAGEEISWGQRIFDIQSSDFFKNNNIQKETNLHNLKIGDIRLNQLVFSQILTGVMALYLLLIPVLYQRVAFVRKLINQFAVPIPQVSHILAFVVSTLFIVILPNLGKKWEVYELFFSMIFLLIFLNPVNKEIFLRKSSTDS